MKTKSKTSQEKAARRKIPKRASRARIPDKPKAPTLRLELEYPGARRVSVAGTFNDWNPERDQLLHMEGGRWFKELSLKPGTYEYRFVVDGKWMPDPQADRHVANEFGDPNSILEISASNESVASPPAN